MISLWVQSLSWLIPQQYLTLIDFCFLHFPSWYCILTSFFFSLSYISFLGWSNLPLLISSVLVGVCQDCVLGPLPSDWSTLPGWPHPCPWCLCTVTMPLTPASYLEVPRTSLDSLSPKSKVTSIFPTLVLFSFCLPCFSNGLLSNLLLQARNLCVIPSSSQLNHSSFHSSPLLLSDPTSAAIPSDVSSPLPGRCPDVGSCGEVFWSS